MLIEFTVTNFRSFRTPATLSMLAANLRSKDAKIDQTNVFRVEGQPPLLTSAVIYGRNASGKSNLVAAIAFMRHFVLTSFRATAEDFGGIDVEPFRLTPTTLEQPSSFEIVFVVEGVRYRYGFEATAEQVVAEWLYHVPKTVEAMVFRREQQTVKVGRSFRAAHDRIQFMRPNALFLSTLAGTNAQLAQTLLKWFRKFNTASGINDIGMRVYTMHQMIDGRNIDAIAKFMTSLDTGIEAIHVEKRKHEGAPTFPTGMPENIKSALTTLLADSNSEQVSVRTVHSVYDEHGRVVGQAEFDIDEQESEGTRKLFALAGPVSAALAEGRPLVIDEFDARLHPLLTRQIIELFNNPVTNPRHAQLIVVTHDTDLLDNHLMRRDQIWFVEKDSRGSSTLYSLAEFKGVRNDKDYEKGYIEGRYGAIPFVKGLAEAIEQYEVEDAVAPA
jgi:AAA15 family ATPase/GTPase